MGGKKKSFGFHPERTMPHIVAEKPQAGQAMTPEAYQAMKAAKAVARDKRSKGKLQKKAGPRRGRGPNKHPRQPID